jgi:hypothetical protein
LLSHYYNNPVFEDIIDPGIEYNKECKQEVALSSLEILMMLFYRKYLLDSGYKTKEKESVKV